MATTEDTLPGNWKQTRTQLKERWHGLTDEDINLVAGSRSVLASILCEKYAYTEPQAQEEIERFVHDLAVTPQV